MPRRRLLVVAVVMLLLPLLLLPAAVFYTLVHTGAEPAWTMPLSLPSGARLPLKVAPVLRAASSPLGRRLLDNMIWHTRTGSLRFEDRNDSLVVHCTGCSLHLPQFADEPVRIPQLSIALHLAGDHVSGLLSASDGDAALRVLFDGELSDTALALNWVLPPSRLPGLFRLVRSVVPEARVASIKGSVTATGTLRLPERKWTALPQVEGFEVDGLGTERLRHGVFTLNCRSPDGSVRQRLAGDGAPGWIGLKKMGHLPLAVLAAEDARFYHHAGYDLAELTPLLANADRSGHRGASTITQQLAKNFFVGGAGTGVRKLRELLYTVEMERTLGKRRILTLYLNTVDWGPGLCGAADASGAYFARTPTRLRPAEAAWLAGILRNPHRAYRREFLTDSVEDDRLNWMLSQLPRSYRKNPHIDFARIDQSATPPFGR